MVFELSKEHTILKDMYREFADTEVAPIADEVDKEERFPLETVDKMRPVGFFGVPFPREMGGAGGDILGYALAVEELSRACATTGVILSAHVSLAASPIFEFGTDRQKEEHLIPLASGQRLGAFALTEPNAGTDAAAQQTTAIPDGDQYVLNGTKMFITNSGYADTYIIMAMTDKSAGTRGISAFIVPADAEGFSAGPKEDKLGIRGSATAELILQDVRIPRENRLGKEGEGFKIAMQTLDGGRIGIAAQALGIAQGALDKTVEYVKERRQFKRSLAKFQNTQFELADMASRVEAARLLTYKAACCKDRGRRYSQEAAMAKYVASQTAMDVTTRAIQLHGGYGFIREYDVERMFRDAKITEIYEGTSEVQKMVISAGLLN
jgi:butyryl-CoA dehydrogenase